VTDRLEGACARGFARHETFHPRYGWLRKAVEGVERDQAIFNAEDATVQLGVGKNMVKSIRYWALAAKLIEPTADSGSRNVLEQATCNGHAIFGDDGADPYLEAPGTLWLTHWWLLRPRCEIPVWWLAFNRFTPVEFTEAQLVEFVTEEISRSSWASPNVSSIEKDVSCLLRTYAAVRRGRASIDDLLDCPFRNLGLIEEVSADAFRFVLGRKPGLPPEVVLYAVIDWMAMQVTGARTVALSRLVAEPGTPGRVFRLGDTTLAELLSEAVSLTGIGVLSASAGTRQLAVAGDLDAAKQAVLKSYYRRVHLTLKRPLDRSSAMAGASA